LFPLVPTATRRPLKSDFMTAQQIVATAIGTGFLLFLMIVGLTVPKQTRAQQRIFFTVQSVAAAAFGALLPGALNVKIESTTLGVAAQATGALGIFLIAYFVDPVKQVTKAMATPATTTNTELKQDIKAGDKSKNVQAGRDANIKM